MDFRECVCVKESVSLSLLEIKVEREKRKKYRKINKMKLAHADVITLRWALVTVSD